MDVPVASDLCHKRWPDEALQNLTDLTKKALRIDPANITNHIIIFFVKNFYNKDIT